VELDVTYEGDRKLTEREDANPRRGEKTRV